MTMTLERGDTVRVERWPGVACWYIGPEMTTRYVEQAPACWACESPELEYDGNTVGDVFVCWDCGSRQPAIIDFDEIEEPTGMVIVCMVGDDRRHAVWPDEITPIDEGDYCGSCGQIGCGWGH